MNLGVEVVAGGGLGMIDVGDWERQHRGTAMAGIMASRRGTDGLCDRIEGCRQL
jgi:hypothetical protein